MVEISVGLACFLSFCAGVIVSVAVAAILSAESARSRAEWAEFRLRLREGGC